MGTQSANYSVENLLRAGMIILSASLLREYSYKYSIAISTVKFSEPNSVAIEESGLL